MRIVPVLLLAAAPLASHASSVDAPMDALISKLSLSQQQAEAIAACIRDVPDVREMVSESTIARYCLVRHGAPRQQALFLGVQLSAELLREGRANASDTVDALIEKLELRAE